jgi:ATP-dependent Lon protease
VPGPEPSLNNLEIPQSLPIYPLVTTVLFPSGVAALQIADERNLELAESLTEEKDLIGLFCLLPESRGGTAMRDLQQVGVAAKVVQKLKLGDHRQQILCHGLTRIQLQGIERTEPFLVGRVSVLEPRNDLPKPELEQLMKRSLAAFGRLASADERYSPETVEVLRMNVDSGAEFFSDLLASFLNVALDEKRKLIGMVDPSERLGLLAEVANRELARSQVENDIREKVRENLDERRREHFLREQLRIIQDTLGETTGPSREAGEYAAMIENLPLDDEAKRFLERECERLASMPEQSAEYPVQSNYLDTVFGLPWWERTQDNLDLRKVQSLLSRRHYGVEEIKERLIEYLSVIKLKGHISGPILCLAGPPGTGKTSLGRSISEAMGRKFVPISLGGVSDESEVRGHRKTYVGAMPGKLISAYDTAGSKNPVILLDEIDKMGQGLRGDPSAALLEVLDPEQNTAFVDRYIGVPFDLSETLFIATANLLDTVPPPLRDRLEILQIAGYTEEEKVIIARRFMLPKLLDAHGLEAGSVKLSRAAIVGIIRGYTSEAGVRNLERNLARICRKLARRRAQKEDLGEKIAVGINEIQEYLGPVRFEQEFAARRPEVGVATGLAWTGAGGEILFIEASRMEGKGRVKVTGQLGEVMRESVEAAYSYVRAHARGLEIPSELPTSSDVHIHFPAGAIPKDGPSAGMAVATCLASLLSGRPVRHDVAMTGEITLRGKILSVGGIKEKVLAAHRARVKRVLLPMGNKKDLGSIPEEVREAIEIVCVDRIEEAWGEALVPLLVANDDDIDYLRAANS